MKMETENQNIQKTTSNHMLLWPKDETVIVDLPPCDMTTFLRSLLPEREYSEGRRKLMSWLNQQMKVHLIDGRILVGTFVCTDKDAHIILCTCYEYFNEKDLDTGESRLLGLVMIPGRHIVSIHTDEQQTNDQSNKSSSNFEQTI